MAQPGRVTARAGADWRAEDTVAPTPLAIRTAQVNCAGAIQVLAEPRGTMEGRWLGQHRWSAAWCIKSVWSCSRHMGRTERPLESLDTELLVPLSSERGAPWRINQKPRECMSCFRHT
jgi:hypothetical protein